MAERVQVRGPKGRRTTRPTASPVSSYSRQNPQPPVNGAMQLAKSLETVKPGISRLVEQNHKENRKEGVQGARSEIEGMTFEDAKKAVDDGAIAEHENPWFRASFMKSFGQRRWRERRRVIEEEYRKNPNRASLNAEEFIRERMQGDIDEIDNEFYRKGYEASAANDVPQMIDQHLKVQGDRFHEEARESQYSSFQGIIQDGVEDDLSVDEIQALVRQEYQGTELNGVTNAEKDEELLRAIGDAADKGNVEVVTGLLNADRGEVPSLSSKGKTKETAKKLVADAEANRLEQLNKETFPSQLEHATSAAEGELNEQGLLDFHKNFPGLYTNRHVESLVKQNRNAQEAKTAAAEGRSNALIDQGRRDQLDMEGLRMFNEGRFHDIQDAEYPKANGTRGDYSRSSRRDRVLNMVLDASKRTAERKGETPEQTMNRELKWFSQNGAVHTEWKDTLNNGVTSASIPAIDHENPPKVLQESLGLYMQLHAKSPQYLNKMVTDGDSRNFYETYRVGSQVAGLTHQQSLSNALQAHRDPNSFNAKGNSAKYSLIEREAKNIRESGTSWFKFGDEEAGNMGDMTMKLERLAKYYVKTTGLDGEKAMAQARERLVSTHEQVNGWMVDTSHVAAPPDFPDLATAKTRRWAKESGEKYGYEADDLTVRQRENSPNSFEIVHKATGLPVHDSGRFTMDELKELREEMKAEEISQKTKGANQHMEDVEQDRKNLDDALRRSAP